MAMKFKYDADVDVVYLRLTDKDIVDSEELQPGMIVDFDANGKIVAIEFLNATDRFTPETIGEIGEAA